MSELQLRQTLSALDLSRSQLDNVARQQEIVRESLQEHVKAKDTVEHFKKAAENEETLIPIGAGMFLHARIGSVKSGVASIGAGVLVEKDLQEISSLLDSRIEELQHAVKNLDAEAEKISGAIEELSSNAQQQYISLQKGGEPDISE